MTGPRPIDEGALERLREWGGDTLVNQLIELFVSTLPERLGAVRTALAGGDLETGARGAHSLRSTSKNLGADLLSELSAEVERALNRGDRSIENLVSRLEDEANRVLEVFQGPADSSSDEAQSALPRIAVVEDNPDNRLLVQALIGDQYDITEYETGKEALDGITADPPDVVLLDISLPEMDGTEVLQHVRARGDLNDLPIIALTAHAMAGDREKYLAMGFDDYVTKPIVDESVLVEAIERWRTKT